MKMSPMMAEYVNTKNEYKDSILFYRLGDFYEMFFDDAILVSRELELTLTGRSCGLEERAPMCGVPFHAADVYISKLVEKGYSVAICEQVEDPKEAKGLVKREVIRIVTPGTVTAQSVLNEKENNFLACVYYNEKGAGISYVDISTGELFATEISGVDVLNTLLNELVKIKPKEILFNENESFNIDTKEIEDYTGAISKFKGEAYYSLNSAEKLIKNQFNTISLVGLGIDGKDHLVQSLGALLSYLYETQMQSLNHLTSVEVYQIGKHMSLDKATLRNLEILETLYDKRTQGSLLGVLDKTGTAMGSRLLKQWLKEPLNDLSEINERLDAVSDLYDESLIRNNLRESLKAVYDFQRLAGRIACGRANGKDLIALKSSIAVLPDIKDDLDCFNSKLLRKLHDNIHDLHNIYDLIDRAIVEDPPFTIKEGGVIKEGYSQELDDIKLSIRDSKQWIANLESIEKEKTGIKNLKVGFNKVFGYYIEVSKSQVDQVPDTYIRKQTLVNGERFITPELKEKESVVLNAESKINNLEYEIFSQIRDEIEKYIKDIQETSKAIATLDVLCSFAHVSFQLGYVRPDITEKDEINILQGRHPVIEQMIEDGLFVANDLHIDCKNASCLLITGPNMAGKSTYMRQVALIVLMAQAGCFVPCEKAEIGIVDRIFTRIGASDNLSQGQSTFFVEMNELSYILRNASERSLVILDEIGRGTSTYDGMSIAWATVEYLCNENSHVRTLFATHYHELTALEEMIKGVKNLNVDVLDEGDNIVFLHKIVEGPASRSYGIHVAKLAGIPQILLDNAQVKLDALEEDEKLELAEIHTPPEESQVTLLDLTSPVISKLKDLDLMEITPSKAIKILEELKELV
ncbi:MAG: DNA mismatch repair protein MutS [Clostridia bacterium]|nr:DNA mismatch repair protein MutS [Clostridia bacterium]